MDAPEVTIVEAALPLTGDPLRARTVEDVDLAELVFDRLFVASDAGEATSSVRDCPP